jgi:hypothetical protein
LWPDLAAQRAWEPDDDFDDAVLPRKLGHNRCTVRSTALEDTERACQNAKLVAQRDADAPLARIDCQNPPA